MFFLSCFLISLYQDCDARVFARDDESDDFEIIKKVILKVQRDYVNDVSTKDLVEYAVRGVLNSLDVYSVYYNPEDFKELKIISQGKFGGTGMQIIREKDMIKVVRCYRGGPSYNAGIMSGDYIIKIDDRPACEMGIEEAANMLRGKPGTNVVLSIYRETSDKRFKLEITRDIVNIAPVESEVLGNKDIIYFKLGSTFNKDTAKNIQKEYSRLLEKMSREYSIIPKGLIMDIRYNPGGLLNQALEVVELFMDKGTIVVTKGRNPEFNRTYIANGRDITQGLPIVILINQDSASASEIVAGALQDNKRAVILGTPSFGKGSVQNVLGFQNGAGMKLTTAKYYTPKGRSIDSNGIIPDILVGVSEKEKVSEQRNVDTTISSHQDDVEYRYEFAERDRSQLNGAIDVLNNLKIYNGILMRGENVSE